MKVLNLVTNRSPFFKDQIKILGELGIKSEVVEVPNDSPRTVKDYFNFYPKVLSNSLSERFDLVHANYGLTAPFAQAQPQRPLILTLWGSDLRLILQEGPKGTIARKFSRLRSFDEIMVRSEEMRRNLKKEFGLDAHIVPSGVDLRKFQPMEKGKAKKEVGWELDVKHILFPYPPTRDVKNYPLAEEVVETVKSRTDQEIELKVVYGVPHDKIPVYYNAADVMLLTSKSEGSPNTVKEAMSCNTPVVATNVGDVSYLLDGVKKSKVGENKVKLMKEIINIIKYNNKSSNGRKRVKKLGLDLKTMGNKISKVYKKALRN